MRILMKKLGLVIAALIFSIGSHSVEEKILTRSTHLPLQRCG